MDSQKQNNKNRQNNRNKRKDDWFFKKVWYAMTKFEKYPEMAAHGVPRAFIYLIELIAVFSVILTIFIFTYANKFVNIEEQKDDLNFVQRFEKTLGIKLDESHTQELNEALNQYDSRTLEAMFAIASIVSIFISYFIITLVDILILSIFGVVTCFFTRISMKYRAVFNMSVYSITISVILRLIYEGLLIFADFEIKYFYIMYTSIAYICLAAAIFMIRSDLIKQQIELMKVIEEKKQKAIEDEQKQKKDDEEERKEKPKEKKKKNDEQENSDLGRGEEQGSNA